MASLQGFNANEVEPTTTFEPIPSGKYTAVITESEMRATQSGNGEYLKLTFEITEGEFKGRKVWENLNLNNPSADAVRIARANLSAICRAVNVPTPNDSCELHNLPLTIKVAQESSNGFTQNRIKGYEKKDNSPPTLAGTFPQGGTSVPPWERRK